VRATLARHEQASTTGSSEYEAAGRVYEDRHICRVPRPAYVDASLREYAASPVNSATLGPRGTLSDWDIRSRLGEITVPTLLINGRYDDATPEMVSEMHDLIPGSEWTVFEHSSHLPHIEEPDAFLARVEAFLTTVDAAL
jgi:L-proline amide hydrolase